MRRRLALLFAGLVAGGTALAAVPSAQAASLCVTLDVNVNGQGTVQNVCLPPDGTPELP